MNVKVINEDSGSAKYHIRPEDININRHFYSAFGWAEVEILANYLVRFFQKLGGWKAFRLEDLNKFWAENGGNEEFLFNRTDKYPHYWLCDHLLVLGNDRKYRVTDYFIERCFVTSPNKGK